MHAFLRWLRYDRDGTKLHLLSLRFVWLDLTMATRFWECADLVPDRSAGVMRVINYAGAFFAGYAMIVMALSCISCRYVSCGLASQ